MFDMTRTIYGNSERSEQGLKLVPEGFTDLTILNNSISNWEK